MTTEPSPYTPQKIKHEDLVKALGTGTNSGSFEGKMRCVYELTEVVIEEVERAHEKVMQNGWKNVFLDLKSASLDARYQNHKKFSPKKPTIITDFYIEILKNANDLRNQLALLESINNGRTTSATLKDSINIYLAKESYSRKDLSAAIPIFFALQHYAWTLDCYLTGKFPLTSKKERTERASKGGKVSNEGRTQLIKEIREIISEVKVDIKYTSLEELYHAQYLKIDATLDGYSKRRLLGNENMSYKTPKKDNMPDLFQQWAREDEGFKKEIDRLVQKK